jgi:SAM-dependent methyltransferase
LANPDYDRTRPTYPIDGVRWAMGAEPKVVIDLGCGPGKLTSQLSDLGHSPIGVDPSLTMLAGLRAKDLPGVCGLAETIPCRSGSVDAITAAQAFHWFDKKRAVPEMRRVLRGNGRVGLFWNLRDDSVDWVRALSDIVSSEDAISATLGRLEELTEALVSDLTADGFFTSVEHHIFSHEQELTEDLLVGLIRSRSYISLLPEDERDRVLGEVRRLCREHAQLQGRERFMMPYKTRVFRAVATDANDG